MTPEERKALAEATLRNQASSEKNDSADLSVQDPTVKAMYQRGLVSSDHVEAALALGSDTSNLWRMLLDVDGVGTDDVYRFVAAAAGFREFPYLDATPSHEFIEELVPGIGRDTMMTLLAEGLLPVDFEPGLSAAPSRVTLVTKDPTHPSLESLIESLPFSVELTFAPEATLSGRLTAVMGWMSEASRYGTNPETDVPAPAPMSAAPLEVSGDVLDLGSYGVDGGLVIQEQAAEDAQEIISENHEPEGVDVPHLEPSVEASRGPCLD